MALQEDALQQKPKPKPKAIVLCSDGTGNSAIKDRGTNVFRLYEALDLHGHESNPKLERQIAFYDDGVGTQSNPVMRFLGNAFGWGLARNVRELYASLCEVWVPGDRIYLFGFSRGAYTARYLAALIAWCGVVRINATDCAMKRRQSHQELEDAAATMFNEFRKQFRYFSRIRSKKDAAQATSEKAEQRRRLEAIGKERCWTIHDAEIEFVGVWDTVDAYGFPADWVATLWNQFVFPFRFPDFELDPKVKRGCHAIALDDERKSFRPSLWDERREKTENPRIEQVWFSGVHSNVGGGYPKQGLALESLCWMIDRAEKETMSPAGKIPGLRFIKTEKDYFHERRDPTDKLYDSRAGPAVYYSYEPRDVGKRMREVLPKKSKDSKDVEDLKPRIHLGVIERIALRVDGYGPLGIPKDVTIETTERRNADQDNVRKAIEGELATSHGESVLARAAFAIRLRRWSHIVMLMTTLVLVYALKHLHGWGIFGKMITSPVEFVKWVVERYASGDGSWPVLGLAVVLVVAYIIGYFAKKRIEGVASNRWYETAEKLRTLLADYHAAGDPHP